MQMQTVSISRSDARDRLFSKYKTILSINPHLSRKLVSYQANKNRRIYNWFRYREGFSAAIVEHLLTSLAPKPGRLLDPFAGAGTALFASSELGWHSTGIGLSLTNHSQNASMKTADFAPFLNILFPKIVDSLLGSGLPATVQSNY